MAAHVHKLTRAQMQELLLTCFQEGRPPSADELTVRTAKRVAYATARSGTGLFETLDDDTLTEVLRRLPMKMRIAFARSPQEKRNKT